MVYIHLFRTRGLLNLVFKKKVKMHVNRIGFSKLCVNYGVMVTIHKLSTRRKKACLFHFQLNQFPLITMHMSKFR